MKLGEFIKNFSHNNLIRLHYKDKEEADKKYQHIIRRIPHIIIED